MRCPKCGYISFDRQKACGKCSNDLTAVAAELQGTVGKAAAPFFLGAILEEEKTYAAESGFALRGAEELLALDEQEAQALPAEAEEFELVEEFLVDDDPEDQALPGRGLEDIDVSDLMPLPAEKEKPGLSMEVEPAQELAEPVEQESQTEDLEIMMTGSSRKAQVEANRDYSSLIDFAEATEMPEESEEIHDIFELCLEDEKIPAPAAEVKNPARAGADIPDLGLTLENDDH